MSYYHWESAGFSKVRLVTKDGQIADEIERQYDGSWKSAYSGGRFVSKEAAQAASERIHGMRPQELPDYAAAIGRTM